jgi:hypothetical protein
MGLILNSSQAVKGQIVRRGQTFAEVIGAVGGNITVKLVNGDKGTWSLAGAPIFDATEQQAIAFLLDTKNLKVSKGIDEYEHSEKLKVWLQWLKDAGPEGVMNTCGCPRDEFWNTTCECRTSAKIYHRFSCFTEKLRKLGFEVEDDETDSGRHKTILISEPTVKLPVAAPCA